MTSIQTLALTPAHDLILQQLDLEEEMTKQGVERFRASITAAQTGEREDGTVYGTSILNAFISKVGEGVTEFVESRETGKAGRKGPTYKYVKAFDGDHDTMAFIALRYAICGLTKAHASATSLAGMIGRAVEDEFRYRAVRDQDRKFYFRLQKEAAERSAMRVKRKVVNFFIGRREFDLPEQWPEKDLVLLGMMLLEIVATKTGLFTAEPVKVSSKETKTILVPTAAALEFIASRVASAEVMRPLYEPMIVPPVAWTGPFGGGYLTATAGPRQGPHGDRPAQG